MKRYFKKYQQGPKAYDNFDYIYTTADFEPFNDPHMFIAGKGTETMSIFNTVDGYVYAIPLFEVARLNTTGYNAYHNVYGAINWQNSSSVSDRVSLDGKFANVIYYNDIQDQRYQAFLGTNELSTKYLQLDNFDTYVHNTQESMKIHTRNIEALIEENRQLRKELEFINLLTI